MLAKLVAHGVTRAEATDRAIAALKELAILGVTTNIDYLIRVLDSAAFRDARLHTAFIEEQAEALAPVPLPPEEEDLHLVAAALGFREFRDMVSGVPALQAAIGQWRN